MAGYETNLASEFYILSVLYRLGMDASLTLGNKKSVDIVVIREAGDGITIDVKAVAGKHDWPVNNVATTPKHNHFIVLVSYEGKINDPEFLPNVWIVPHSDIAQFIKPYNDGKMRVVSRALVKSAGHAYKGAWQSLAESTSLVATSDPGS